MRLRNGMLLACVASSLGGCVPMMATNLANNTARIAVGTPKGDVGSGNAALDACTTRARTYGIVHIINVEQPSRSGMVVWGTIDSGGARRSFRCAFREEIKSFTLRAIPAHAG